MAEKPVGHRGEAVPGVVVVDRDRFARDVPAGDDEWSAQVGEEQMVQGRGGQEQPEPPGARPDRGRDSAVACRPEQDHRPRG